MNLEPIIDETMTSAPGRGPRAIFEAMRPYHWSKNLLILVPLVTSHQMGDAVRVARAVGAFVAFSLVASAVYVLNDILDLPNDRLHPTKRGRPFASERVSIKTGFVMIGILLAAGAIPCLGMPVGFSVLLLAYFGLTTAYSAFLKRQMVVDVITLASLYTLRILAGGAAEGVVISSWLMTFSIFFFLSLAFAKRHAELASTPQEGKVAGRGYRTSDLAMIRSMGPTSGYLSVVVLCLYINSPEVRVLYRHPERLWLLCPVLLYWIARVWFLASREELDEDPILFAIRDRASYLSGLIMVAILLASV